MSKSQVEQLLSGGHTDEVKMVNVSCQLNPATLERLDAVCKKLGIGRSKLLFASLTDTLDSLEARLPATPVVEEKAKEEQKKNGKK